MENIVKNLDLWITGGFVRGKVENGEDENGYKWHAIIDFGDCKYKMTRDIPKWAANEHAQKYAYGELQRLMHESIKKAFIHGELIDSAKGREPQDG